MQEEFPAPGFLRRKAKAGLWTRPAPVYINHDSFVQDPVVDSNGRLLKVRDPRATIPYVFSDSEQIGVAGVPVVAP